MHKIKKYSDFLVEKELVRISKKIGLLKESIEESDNPKENIIKTTTELFNDINAEKIEQELGIDITETKPDISWEITYHKPLEETPKEISETLPEETDILKEVLPKKNDSPEIKTAKKGIIQEISDKLVGKSKKLLLFACLSLMGVAGFNDLFSDKKAVKTAGVSIVEDEDSDGKKISVQSPTTIQFFTPGNIGVGGSIGEVPDRPETELDKEKEVSEKLPTKINKKLELEKKRLSKKYKLIDPTGLKTSDFFDRSKTVFTNASFPYKVNNKYNIDKHFEDDRRDDIEKKYIPALDRAGSNEKTGLKLLALAMTYMEGYKKGTLSYETNNPGNIDNTDSGRKNYIKSLDKGIKLQLDLLKDAANGKDPNYPVGGIVSRDPYWSPDPNLKKWIPGMVFEYEGTIEQFLRVYATGCRNDNNYLNIVLSFFEVYFPGKITKDTKLKDIIALGDKSKISVLIKKDKKEKEEAEKKEKEKKLLADK